MERRVVITGLGAVSPCGPNVERTWADVREGRSGIRRIQSFDPTEFASQIAGECVDFVAEDYVERRHLREMGRFIHLALAASEQAIRSAGFEPDEAKRRRVGTFIGVGYGGLEAVEPAYRTLFDKGPRRMSPYFLPATISNLAPGHVSMRHGFRGPSYATASACSSGAHAIGEAFRWIQRGGIDAAIAGGAEASVCRAGVAGFAAMRALSRRNDDPSHASRPYDVGRDGFVIAEGAGILLLEEREQAIARGAPILAELVGYGASSDAYHLTQPAPNGAGAQEAMRMALDDGRLAPADVRYVNAHGTSTPTGDLLEIEAIRAVFGAHATGGLAVSSTKSVTGHLLGAAGGLEAAITVLAIRDSTIPPTMNLDEPDPSCDGIDLVPHEAREMPIGAALSNSFGFGGTNVSLAFRAHAA